MKILWYSVAPFVASGYGTQTKGVINELTKRDIDVDVDCFSGQLHGDTEEEINGQTVKMYGGSGGIFDKGLINRSTNYDVTVTHMDQWMIPDQLEKVKGDMIHWSIIDQTPPPRSLQAIDGFENTKGFVPMTNWGKSQMEKYYDSDNMFDPIYHGVDLDIFTPDKSGLDDNYQKFVDSADFLVGIIGTNTLREMIPNNLEAFCKFAEKIDEKAKIYVNSQLYRQDGHHLPTIVENLLADYDVTNDQIVFRNPDKNKLPVDQLAALYANMDVHLATTMGDSFGIPICEAGACKTPSIVTKFSAPPELVDDGRGLKVKPHADIWMQRTNSKQKIPSTDDIARALEIYYEDEKKRKLHGRKMRKWAKMNCNWNTVGEQWANLLRREYG